ncbi:MAG: ABC transporter permease subunit [Acidobacteriota bacterium]|nr:ABC transporter permease subunit [Acidobacteriota bacterium]
MPIAEQGYLHWQGRTAETRRPWRAITRFGVRLSFRRKFFKLTLALSLLPAIVFSVGVYLAETIQHFQVFMGGSRQIVAVNPAFFQTYFTSELLYFMLLMLMILAGTGLIADDLKSGSLQLYFARPLRKRDYLLGKLGITSFFILLLTLVPGTVFILLKIIFSGSFRLLTEHPWLPLSVILYSFFLAVLFSLAVLFVSALSKNRRFAGILLFLIYFGSDIAFGVFDSIFHRPELGWISIRANLKQVGYAVFGGRPPLDVPWIVSAVILAFWAGVAVFFLYRRIQSTEVIR